MKKYWKQIIFWAMMGLFSYLFFVVDKEKFMATAASESSSLSSTSSDGLIINWQSYQFEDSANVAEIKRALEYMHNEYAYPPRMVVDAMPHDSSQMTAYKGPDGKIRFNKVYVCKTGDTLSVEPIEYCAQKDLSPLFSVIQDWVAHVKLIADEKAAEQSTSSSEDDDD